MKRRLLLLPVVLMLAALAAPVHAAETEVSPKFTYVIVHGAWGGGWAFKEVDRLLTADGHKVYRPTLTGQGEKVHLANPEINLTTHVTDVVNVILWEDLHNVVLVGHSYGGMVITGVMDRVPDRIKHVIYLDAAAPEDGESANMVLGDNLGNKVTDGFIIPPWLKPGQPLPHDVPHPAKTLSEPVSFKNSAALTLPVTYILTVDAGKKPEDDTFFRFYERAKARGWARLIMEGDHNVQWSHPKELVRLLEQVMTSPGSPNR
jgi:pimeloyl-ACP methyl ester carboxylesterase